jgi:hypothetical protein
MTTEKVELTIPITAFKTSGKYYSDYKVTCLVDKCYVEDGVHFSLYMYDVMDAIKRDMRSGKLPSDFIYHVDHDDGWPCLVFPD